MKFKYYLRGLGIGVILSTLIMMIAFSQNKISDEEVIKRAEALGMVMKEEEPLFSSESETKESETTSTVETQESEVIEIPESTEIEETQEIETTEAEETQETETTMVEDTETIPSENVEVYHLVIPPGGIPRLICNELEEQGVIEDAAALRQYLVDVGYVKSIVVGSYDIPYGSTNDEVYQILKAGPN